MAQCEVCATTCRIVGHGVEADKQFFCCGHCAHEHGSREIVTNDRHVGAER